MMTDAIDKLTQLHPDSNKLPQIKPPGEESDMAADKRAIYMLARAAYSFEDYPKFWARIAQYDGQSNAYSTEHPLTQRRQAAMTRVITEIKNKQATHKAILP